MKKFLAIGLLFTFVIPSCSKQDKQDKIETIYQNNDLTTLRTKPFNPVLNNYTTKIVRMGYDHTALSRLRGNDKFKSVVKKYDLDLSNIQKYTMAYDNELEILYFPIREKTQVLIIYSKHDDLAFILGTQTVLPNGNGHCSYANPENPSHLYYEVQINPENKFGKFVSHNDITMGVQEVVAMPAVNPDEALSLDTPADVSRGCCSLAFNQCMQCFVNSCAADWVCGAACLGLAYWCIGAWSAACLTKTGCNRAF
jgi:hypothetical protein